MPLPSPDPDTLFEELLQDLPQETVQMAREFKAFVRAKKVKTPAQLLRVVFLYCGLDKSLREVAGTFTALYESITDQSVAERLRACGPWVKALLRQMLPLSAVDTLPKCALSRRFADSPERFAIWPQKAEKWHMARLLGVLHRPWRKVHTILYLHHRAAGRLPKQALCPKGLP